jgi:uncharacterized phage protein (TIGR01671 family)
MNRTIKFRGKRTENGEWICGNLVITSNGATHIFDIEESEEDGHHIMFNENSSWVIPETVGQFTGLCDKNGKEIYEGDIIEKKNRHSDMGLFVVEFINGLAWNYNGFGLRKIDDGKLSNFSPDSIWFPSNKPENWDKVIGNIHENKDLLTKN